MSLLLWDPFFERRRAVTPWGFGRRQNLLLDPIEFAQRQIEQMDRLVDRFFDNDMNIQLRDHVGRLSLNEQGDLTYQVDVSGFRPEELKVELQGNELVVQGEHKEQNEGESVHRQFVRRVLIPEGIQRETIKCDMSSDGRLSVTGQKQAGEAPRSIPIEIGKAVEQKQPAQVEADKQKAR